MPNPCRARRLFSRYLSALSDCRGAGKGMPGCSPAGRVSMLPCSCQLHITALPGGKHPAPWPGAPDGLQPAPRGSHCPGRAAGAAWRASQPRAFHGDTCDMGTWKTNAQAPAGCGGQGKPPLPHLTERSRNHSVPCSLHGF